MIEWDETEVLACLEVAPEIGDDALYHRYAFVRGDVYLDLVVCQFDGDVHLTVRRSRHSDPLVDVWMRGCRGIKRASSSGTDLLHFVSHDDRQYQPNLPYGLVLHVRPDVRIVIGDSLARTTSL